jgi:hypothetical protein
VPRDLRDERYQGPLVKVEHLVDANAIAISDPATAVVDTASGRDLIYTLQEWLWTSTPAKRASEYRLASAALAPPNARASFSHPKTSACPSVKRGASSHALKSSSHYAFDSIRTTRIASVGCGALCAAQGPNRPASSIRANASTAGATKRCSTSFMASRSWLFLASQCVLNRLAYEVDDYLRVTE